MSSRRPHAADVRNCSASRLSLTSPTAAWASLSRPRLASGPRDRAQDPAAASRRRRLAPPVPAGSAIRIGAHPPQYRHHPRRGRGGRDCLPRHGVRRRPHAAQHRFQRRTAGQDTPEDRRAGRRRAHRGARQEHRAPRSEARKHPRDRRGGREGPRLRPGEAAATQIRRQLARDDLRDQRRRGARHGGIHVARAGARRADRFSVRSVLVRLDSVRARHGSSGVQARVDRPDGVRGHRRASGIGR